VNLMKRFYLNENATTTILLLMTGLFFAGSLLVFNCLSRWTEAKTALESYQISLSGPQKISGMSITTDSEAAATMKSLRAREIRYRNNFWTCLAVTLILSSINLMFAYDVVKVASDSMTKKKTANSKVPAPDFTLPAMEPSTDTHLIANIHFHGKLLSFQESTDV